MGGISNDPFTLARYVGFYKAIQSAGAAGSFGMDAVATPFLNELVSLSIILSSSYFYSFYSFYSSVGVVDNVACIVPSRRVGYLDNQRYDLHRGEDCLRRRVEERGA